MNNSIPSGNDIISAHSRIKKFIHLTPALTSTIINEICNSELFFKCENFQKAGAFKFRGAANAILKLTKDRISRGVAAHSSGNHGAALALAASLQKIKSYIVMPETAPKQKIDAVKTYGGTITFCKPDLSARETELNKIVSETGAHFIHPYDNYDVIEGQATAAKELIEEIPELDFILAPVGGGGLASGTCLSAEYFGDGVKVIGVEPSGADDAFRSLRDGKIYPSINPITCADGLLTSLSEKTFEILSEFLDRIITVDEDSIIKAMRLIWSRMKIIVEPSSAVVLSAVLNNKNLFENKKVGLIISGGNADLNNLPWRSR